MEQLSRWKTVESVSPMQAVVHHLHDEAQWARVDGLARLFGRQLSHNHPCVRAPPSIVFRGHEAGDARFDRTVLLTYTHAVKSDHVRET
jgi:hypothetical protein